MCPLLLGLGASLVLSISLAQPHFQIPHALGVSRVSLLHPPLGRSRLVVALLLKCADASRVKLGPRGSFPRSDSVGVNWRGIDRISS